jgi:hypothetical protein
MRHPHLSEVLAQLNISVHYRGLAIEEPTYERECEAERDCAAKADSLMTGHIFSPNLPGLTALPCGAGRRLSTWPKFRNTLNPQERWAAVTPQHQHHLLWGTTRSLSVYYHWVEIFLPRLELNDPPAPAGGIPDLVTIFPRLELNDCRNANGVLLSGPDQVDGETPRES